MVDIKRWHLLILILLVTLVPLGLVGQDEEIILDPNQDEKDVIPFRSSYKIIDRKKTSSPLTIASNDILWEFSKNGHYIDLVIRKKRYIGSVLLTNMYYGEQYVQDYGSKAYGLRASSYNTINGNEVRIVNRKVIGKKQSLYFLVDSRPERHRVFGSAFRIRIPRVVEYGYKYQGENFGIISIEKGVTLNLRTYVRRYADHRGKFQNNPIHINFTERGYRHSLKPEISKVEVYNEEGFKVLKVKYFSRINYVKYFLVRDIHKSKTFKRIRFVHRGKKHHESAIVLRAIRKQGEGIYITALIYLKAGSAEKDFDVSAIDYENRIAKNYISYTAPQKERDIKKVRDSDPPRDNDPFENGQEKIIIEDKTQEAPRKENDGDRDSFFGE